MKKVSGSMLLLDMIIDFLKDGKQHSFSDLCGVLKLRPELLSEALIFLSDYSFIHYDEKKNITLDSGIRDLFADDLRRY